MCDWLTTSGPAVGAMLHLAWHGVVRTGGEQPTAYLRLASGGKEQDTDDRRAGFLFAEELIQLMAQAPHRAIGLAVLAACHTGVSMTGYDEAHSLGTAFLAAGVRSVVSEPAQRVPEEMPKPLRDRLVEEKLPAVVAWAAFVHWGQMTR